MATSLCLLGIGRWRELGARVKNNDPAGCAFKALILKTAQTDALLVDHLTVAALLAAGNVQADFTGYALKTVLGASMPALTNPDPTANTAMLDFPDLTWGPTVGTPVDNAAVKIIIAYTPDSNAANSSWQPIIQVDFVRPSCYPDAALIISAGGLCIGSAGA